MMCWLGDSGLVGLGTTRTEDAQGTPTQVHVSPSILVYEDETSSAFSQEKAAFLDRIFHRNPRKPISVSVFLGAPIW